MEEPSIEDTPEETLWFLTERNAVAQEDAPWHRCCLLMYQATDILAQARKVLNQHTSATNIWCRVKVFRNEACLGDPVLVLRNSPEVGPPFDNPSARVHRIPEAELAQNEQATEATPPGAAPPFPSEQLAGTWMSLDPSAGERLTTAGEVTKDKPADDAARVHVTIEGDGAREIQGLVHTIVGLSQAAVAERTENLVIAWAHTLEAALANIRTLTNEAYPDAQWYQTEMGLTAMAHATSGFTAAFVAWKINH